MGGEAVVFYDREERIRRFGIECGDELLWRNGTWQPGGEFCKVLQVKNVGKETIKLKYKPPQTAFFSMDFPEVQSLSPGMSTPVQVVFRPVQTEPYDDYIEFVIKNKKLKWTFYIPLRARLSRVSVRAPECEDFGFTPIKETGRRTFQVQNTGTVNVEYRWQVEAPFCIEPATGHIEDVQTFTASFAPLTPSVFVSKALLHVKGLDSSPLVFKMSGIGKFPFITLSEDRLDFGGNIPGTLSELEVVIRNQSFVPATFDISRVENDVPSVFTVEPLHGCILPGEMASLRVTYEPRALGQFSCDNYVIATPGGNSTSLACVGACVGPDVIAAAGTGVAGNAGSDHEVQFGEVRLEEGPEGALEGRATRVVRLANRAHVDVRYQFFIPPHADFEVVEPAGFVPALLDKSITIHFRPRQPGNYYQRVFCVLLDQMPHYFDLLGTAFDPRNADRRPQPLLYRHVLAHRRRELQGLDREAPERILRLEEGAPPPEPSTFPENQLAPAPSGNALHGDIETFNQLFERTTDEGSRVISVSTDCLEFGSSSRLQATAQKRTLRVTNNHQSKVTCAWRVNWPGPNEPPFAVFPESQDISPGQTAEFRVMFRPTVDGLYYHATATSYVQLKSNRTFRLVDDAAFVPPFSVTVGLSGNTFPPHTQHFLPRVAILVHSCGAALGMSAASQNSHYVEFPACHLGSQVFTTAVLQNTGDTPVKFTFARGARSRFDVVPHFGLVQPGDFQILCFRSSPLALGEHEGSITCILNESKAAAHVFHLTSLCCTPRVELVGAAKDAKQGPEEEGKAGDSSTADADDDAGVLFLRPTCVGLVTRRFYELHNVSRVPCTFEWRIPKRFRNVLSVKPESGSLRGNETMHVEWIFTPNAEQVFEIDAVLFVRSMGDCSQVSHAIQARQVLSVRGAGSGSFMTLDCTSLNMGAVLANGEAKQKLSITNHSPGDAQFVLTTKAEQPGAVLRLSETEGVISARSSREIEVTFCPSECGSFNFELQCRCGPEGASCPESEDIVLTADIFGRAANPVLAIEDARCMVSSTAHLWKQFDLARLNTILSGPVTEAEHEYVRSTGVPAEDGAEDIRDKLETVHFRFLPADLGSATQSVALQLKNTGELPVAFHFKLPNETDIDVEPWADSREPDEAEMKQHFILDEKIFTVEPRRGMLAAGEAAIVRVAYEHTTLECSGQHSLEVMLCLRNGKQVRLVLQGETLGRRSAPPAVFPFALKHQLQETAIGLCEPPVQTLELLNPAVQPSQYTVDLGHMEALNRGNYDFPVLRCLNPEGTIVGRETHRLEFVFQPLEAKLYTCMVPVQVRTGSGEATQTKEILLQLEGRGFQPPLRPEGPRLTGIAQPVQQLLPQHGQLASLSSDVLDFGDSVLDRAVVRRLTFVRNQTATPLAFAWDVAHPLVEQGILNIEPDMGELAPGAFVVCKVVIRNEVRHRAVIDEDIACHVEPRATATVATAASSSHDAPSLSSLPHRSFRSESRASSMRPTRTSPRRNLLNKVHEEADKASVAAQAQALHLHLRATFVAGRDAGASVAGDSFCAPPCAEALGLSLGLGAIESMEAEAEKTEGPARGQEERKWQRVMDVIADPLTRPGLDAIQKHSTPLFSDFLARVEREKDEARPAAGPGKPVRDMLLMPECQRLVEAVLENSLSNLIQEAVHGEVDLLTHRTLLYPREES